MHIKTPDYYDLITSPSAALAPYGGRASQSKVRDYDGVVRYPMVYGANVWVHRPPVISERKVGGKWERLQVVSVGQFAGDDCGSIQELDLNIYDDCERTIGTLAATDFVLGLPKQTALTDAFYIPCEGGCCDCPATGDGPVRRDVADQITASVTSPDADLHAWSLLVNGAPVGTLWSDSVGESTFRIGAPLPGTVELLPINDAGVLPYYKMTPGVAGLASGLVSGQIASLVYAGTPVVVEAVATFSMIAADIDPTCRGLCVVKTLTSCAHPPSFRVKRGRSIRNIYAGGYVSTTVAAAIADKPIPAGAIYRNHSTRKSGDASLAFAVGDAFSVYTITDSKYLSDVVVNVSGSVGGGLNVLVNPDSTLDYEYLVLSREYCVKADYEFAGAIANIPFSQFLQTAAPQSGLLLTQRGGLTGLYPDDPEHKAVRLFTPDNANDFGYAWEHWDNHATNRLITRWDRRAGIGSTIVQSSTLKAKQESWVEESLRWDYANLPAQVQALAGRYYTSIKTQRMGVRLVATIGAYDLDPGQVFEVMSPAISIRENFSGRAAVVKDGEVIASWEPVIASGRARGEVAGQIVDAHANFLVIVEVGDLAVFGDGTALAVTAVTATTLTLAGDLPSDRAYKILDLTLPTGTTMTVYSPTTQEIKSSVPVTVRYNKTNQKVVYKVAGVKEGDLLSLAKSHLLWRCATVTPVSDGQCLIRGTQWYPGLKSAINAQIIT